MKTFIALILFSPYLEWINNFKPYNETIPDTDITIPMVPVEGGEFNMGSKENETGRDMDEGPVHNVKVNDFWLCKYEITWEQYEAFLYRDSLNEEFIDENKLRAFGMALDGISSATQPYLDMSFGMGKEGFPAVNITHHAALSFCKWLTAKTGNFYRLPTEAEWEYAARAGTQTRYFFGNNEKDLDEYSWFKNNSGGRYHKIGEKKPNPLGLYDMLGNVAEWTMDKYEEDFYSKSGYENPWNIPDKLYPRVIRGGSWKDPAENLRCADRKGSEKEWKQRDPQLPKSRWWHTNAPFVGFRILRPRVTPDSEKIKKFWLKVYEDY